VITISIGNETKNYADATESWIAQQINRRRLDGQNVCVDILVNTSGLNIQLTTPGCDAGGGGGREATDRERRLFDLWDKHGLNSPNFSGGSLISFLKWLRQLVA